MGKNFKGWEKFKPKLYVDVLKESKYRNKKTEVDGILFDSKKEANRYRELKIKEKAGLISKLTLKVVYRLEVNGILICKYIGDFDYLENGKWVMEDVKGFRTKEYILKRKLMLAIHGIEIKEV